VLTAFAQAEDYIAELRVTSQQLNRQEAALSSAQTYVTLETGRYETGLDPYPNLITARLTLLSSEEARVTLRMNELTEAVELIQSLGGGWNVSQLPSPESIRRCGVVQQVKDGP
jgi:outer membrane protein TolC